MTANTASRLAPDHADGARKSDIGDRAGRLGVEIADVAGLIADLSAISQQQELQAEAARNAAGEMNAAAGQLGQSMTTTRAAAADMRPFSSRAPRRFRGR